MNGSHQAALHDATVMFARRLSGSGADIFLGPLQPEYDGGFDYMAVVNAATPPHDNTEIAHRRAWAAFRDLFERTWRDYRP